VIIIRVKAVLAGFTLGALIGAAGLNLALGKHLDKAELEIRKLRLAYEEQTEQLQAAEKELAIKTRVAVVNEITVNVIFEDEYERIEIETAVRKLLRNLKGKEVSSLDPLLVSNILDGRTITTPDSKYILTVKGILVSEKIVMYIEAKEVEEQSILDRTR